MKENNLKEELRKLDEEATKIREKKSKLLDEAKDQALARVNEAIRELNELGFHYRLVEDKETIRPTIATRGTRRSGIRDQVLSVISGAGTQGIAPAAIRDALGITDKSGAQAVANALSSLKRQQKIKDANGAYVVA